MNEKIYLHNFCPQLSLIYEGRHASCNLSKQSANEYEKGLDHTSFLSISLKNVGRHYFEIKTFETKEME